MEHIAVNRAFKWTRVDYPFISRQGADYIDPAFRLPIVFAKTMFYCIGDRLLLWPDAAARQTLFVPVTALFHCHALRQIPRLIYVGPFLQRRVIGQHLYRDRMHYRR